MHLHRCIGRPLPNNLILVLDRDTNFAHPVTRPGMVGEIFLGGPQVGCGYIGREALTKQRFLDVDKMAKPMPMPKPKQELESANQDAQGCVALKEYLEECFAFAGDADKSTYLRLYRTGR